MTRADAPAAVRDIVARERARGRRAAFVPTMGFLHEGHLSLVDRARSVADVVVLSIFVNRLQFGPGEDYEEYPRDPERDARVAEERGVDVLFTPSDAVLYPDGEPAVRVVPTRMADRLCGAFRPGHFEGVLTIVAKLFNIVRSDVAVFGQKDYQQAVLIRRMVHDLDMAVEIEVAPIVREADGLALSSRNTYLDADERPQAPALYRGLRRAADAFEAGERDPGTLESLVAETISRESSVEPQYVQVVHPDTLAPVERAEVGTVIAVAAFLGETRLIDNVILGDA